MVTLRRQAITFGLLVKFAVKSDGFSFIWVNQRPNYVTVVGKKGKIAIYGKADWFITVGIFILSNQNIPMPILLAMLREQG